MTERKHANDDNVWLEGQDVKIDFFGPGHDPQTARREDAEWGVILTRERALWLAQHLVEAIGDEMQVDELRRQIDSLPEGDTGA
jgi:hypothetical protein